MGASICRASGAISRLLSAVIDCAKISPRIVFCREVDQMSGQYQEKNQTIVKKTVKTGISFGSALAMVISYTAWHSVGWAILHGLLSWVYVIYYVLRY